MRDIRDPHTLAEFEAEATARRLRQLENTPPAGSFDIPHLQAIHRHIFQDVYACAGEFRTVEISKGGHLFGLTQHIVPFLDKTFPNCGRSTTWAARSLGSSQIAVRTINTIHPFREGNGRTQREFIRQLAVRNGYNSRWSRISQQQMIDASRPSVKADNTALEKLLEIVLASE